MADDDVKPRTNTGKYDESKYSPTRRAFIEMARARGLTSAADRAKVAAMAKGASRGPSNKDIIDIPDPAPSLSDIDISPSEQYRKNYSDIKWEKKAKGGLIGTSQSRGQGKVIRSKTTKHY